MEFYWNIENANFLKYKKAIEERKYYEGFKPEKEKLMFKEEIEDLQSIYANSKKEISDKIDDLTPGLIYYMKKFVEVYEARDAIDEKIEILEAKLVKNTCTSSCQGD